MTPCQKHAVENDATVGVVKSEESFAGFVFRTTCSIRNVPRGGFLGGGGRRSYPPVPRDESELFIGAISTPGPHRLSSNKVEQTIIFATRVLTLPTTGIRDFAEYSKVKASSGN